MGLANVLRLTASLDDHRQAGQPAQFTTGTDLEPAPRPKPATIPGVPDEIASWWAAQSFTSKAVAEAVPSYRRARNVIAGTVSTFALGIYRGRDRLEPLPWLSNPDPARTLSWIMFKTLDDLIWEDASYWLTDALYADDRPQTFRRLTPSRVVTVPNVDMDAPPTYLVDGKPLRQTQRVIAFDAAGLGGLRVAGAATLAIAVALELAAGNYAKAPVPSQTIKSSDGSYLEPDEIVQLVDDYISSRQRTGVGYLQAADLQVEGFSARELQLVEGREYLSTEIARLVGLPADAIDAPSGSSMTYSNRVDRRRELVEALRPWLTVVEQTLSLDTVTRRGQAVRFDVDPYVRDDPAVRATIWQTLIAAGVLTAQEVRALEPLAPSDAAPAAAAALSADELSEHDRDVWRGELLREINR